MQNVCVVGANLFRLPSEISGFLPQCFGVLGIPRLFLVFRCAVVAGV